MFLSSQISFETFHKTIKFQEKSERIRKKKRRKVRNSVGNAFSSDLKTLISKIFPLQPTMGATHIDSALNKQ